MPPVMSKETRNRHSVEICRLSSAWVAKVTRRRRCGFGSSRSKIYNMSHQNRVQSHAYRDMQTHMHMHAHPCTRCLSFLSYSLELKWVRWGLAKFQLAMNQYTSCKLPSSTPRHKQRKLKSCLFLFLLIEELLSYLVFARVIFLILIFLSQCIVYCYQSTRKKKEY